MRIGGKLRGFTLGAVSAEEAQAKARQVEYLLMRINQGLVAIPSGVGPVEFIQYDGQPPKKELPAAGKDELTLGGLRDRYLATHGKAMEANSLATCALHLRHLCSFLGDGAKMCDLTVDLLTRYIEHRGESVGTTTMKKEIATFRAAWRWAETAEMVAKIFPWRALRYPKKNEKPPFSTMAEIERQIAAGGDPDTWWEALYLTIEELADMLRVAEVKARHPWILPMITFAAYTGARRSEIMRAKTADVDFTGNTVLIREKKRKRGERSTRRVPLAPQLRDTLEQWLQQHPGGSSLFCHAGTVGRSKKRSKTTGHQSEGSRPTSGKERSETVRIRDSQAPGAALTTNEIHDHFKRTLAGTKWDKIRGLHCLRHSFISACASKGVDQRLIEEWAGHTNEETSRRYRHLYPSAQQEAIQSVFGRPPGR